MRSRAAPVEAPNRRRQIVLGAIAAVAFLLTAYFVYRFQRSAPSIPDEFRLEGVCLSCKQSGRAVQHASERQPIECPSCRARAFYGWLYCTKCEKRVVSIEPAPDGGPPRVPIAARCPICGRGVGAYIPDDPTLPVKGDAPLPSWPPK